MISAISQGLGMAPVSAKAHAQGPEGANGASSAKVRTVENLKEVNKELYDKVVMGLAMATCRQVEKAQQRQRTRSKEMYRA